MKINPLLSINHFFQVKNSYIFPKGGIFSLFAMSLMTTTFIDDCRILIIFSPYNLWQYHTSHNLWKTPSVKFLRE